MLASWNKLLLILYLNEGIRENILNLYNYKFIELVSVIRLEDKNFNFLFIIVSYFYSIT